MSEANYKVRRATVEDLPQMIELWKLERLPWEQYERHLTDFQVVDNGVGEVQGLWGVQMAAKQARIYSEVFLHAELADSLRDKLWERMQSIIHNHGLIRIWTCETSPFFHGTGFQTASAEQLKKLPAPFGSEPCHWTILDLRPEHEHTQVDMEKEFEIFKEQEQFRTAQALVQANKVKWMVTGLSCLLFVGVLALLSYSVRPDLFKKYTGWGKANPSQPPHATNAPVVPASGK